MNNQFFNKAFRKLKYLLMVSIFMLSAFSGFADHFRYGNMTWQRVPGNQYQIKFKVSMAYKRSYFSNGSSLNVGALRQVGQFSPGVGTTTYPIVIYITAVNYTDDWFYGEWTYTHTYPSTAANYTASFSALAYRIGLPLVNNTLGAVVLDTKVQVGAANINNDAPVSTVQPIINARINQTNFKYQIPAVDPNGNALTYSLTPNGLFGLNTVQPNGLTITPGGLLEWNTNGKNIGELYNVSVRVTDSKGAWSTLDLLIKMVGLSTPSDFDYTVSPQNGTMFDIQPGDSVAFQVKASDVDPGDTVKMYAIGLPPGADFNTTGSNPVIGVFAWKPTGSQEGDYVVNVISEDKVGVQNNTVVFFSVSYKPKFNVPTTPGNNSVFTLKPGDTIQHEVAAYIADSLNKVDLVALSGVKPGMSYTPAFPRPKNKFVATNFKWTPAASDWGINKVIYQANDTIRYNVANDTIYYMVDNPPVITSTPDSIVAVGQPYTYVLHAYDVDTVYGDKLKLEIAQIPSWLTATPNGNNSWVITGTPGTANLGNATILLEVADSLNHIFGTHAGNAIQTYTLNVVPPAGGLKFDGVNDYVRVANPYASFGKEITVDFYAEVDATSGIGSGISQSTENIDGSTHMMWMMHYAPGTNLMQFYISDNGVWKHADATVQPGVHRYTGVASAAGIHIYVDGVLAATSPQVVNNNILNVPNSVMHFGKDSRYAANRFMKGQIDEVRIWNRALCGSEVMAYNTCELTTNDGLVEYYKFNQGYAGANNAAVNTLADASGNSKNGTLQNFALNGTTSNWVSGSINSNCAAWVAPTASISTTTPTSVCFGGSVVLTATSGSSYVWKKNGAAIGGATAQTYTATQSGDYTVSVTSAGGCVATSAATTVTVAPQVTASASVTNALIYNTTTGAINMTVNGGTSPYTYAWSNSETTEDLAGIAAGTYNVTITDAMNCTGTGSFTVGQPAQLTVTGSVSNATIYNVNNGAIDITANGGVGGYTYVWSNNATSQDVSNLGDGNYTVTVTDANGATATAIFTVTEPAELVVTGVVTNATIYNVSNGSIDITPAGGVGPYAYAWSNSGTTQDVTGLGDGTYTVTVTDHNGATAITTFTVTEPAELTIAGTVSNATIYNVNNGSIDITPAGGVGPYTYAWSNNGTTQDATGLGDGTYSVTVTDANGAAATATFTVTEPAELVATGTVTNATIYNVNNGSIDVTVTGGVGPYTYVWSNNANSQDVSSLGDGTYTVTVTDANGATATATFTVTEPAQLVVTATATNATIYNVNNGSIDITVAGGVGPYTYVWNNNATTQDLAGLGDGTYTVTVTDANGATATITVTITEPAQLTVAGVVSNATIYNVNNGSIDVTVAGGVGPYTYVWNNNAATQDLTGLGDGSYTVTVTDANGATAAMTFSVTEPEQLVVSGVVSNATIYNVNNGSVNITPAGGVGPYTYAWSNNATSEDLGSIGAGTYAVTVTDANGATATGTYTVGQPAQLVATSTVSNATIYNVNNGSIDVTVAGGVGPYTYAWSNNATTQDLTGVGAGTYTVIVTDANGATFTATYTITQPAQLTVAGVVTNVTVFNGNNGTVNITANGGVGPYTYVWNNNSTVEDRTGLAAGTYSVTVTDANGATATGTYTITQPAQLTVSGVVTNATIFNASNGSINITANGGVGPYTYAWSNNATSEDLGSIGAGTYTVTITDANGATATATYTVTQPAQLNASIAVSPVTPVPGQAPYTIYDGYGPQSVTLTASATGGVAGYTYSWSPAIGLSNANIANPSASPNSTTTYMVTVTDSKGAVATVSRTIYVIDVRCNNNKVKICHLPIGNTGNPQQLCLPASAIPAHLAHGCYLGDCLEVYDSKSNVACHGGNNGAINLTVSGGVPPYNYSWSNNATTEDISGLVAGTYTVTVTAADNRVVTESFTITQPSAPLSATASIGQICSGNNNGSINQTVTGGTAPYSYDWANSNCNTQDRSGLGAGTYSVTITDSKGCSITKTYTIAQPTPIVITGVKTNVSCKDGDNGAIDITVSGGNGPYSYSWNDNNNNYYNYNNHYHHNCHSWWMNWCNNHNNNNNCNQTTQDLNELEAGTYVVTVTDANGCTQTASFTITEPSSTLNISGTTTNVSCNGGSNGAVNLSVSGGSAPYTYSWSNNATTQDISGVAGGTYVVTVTDANGCVKTKSYTISQPSSALSATASVTNTCSGNSNGSIDQTVTGGTAPYSYDWANSNCNSQDRSGLGAGTYSVTITDSKGCSITKTYTIAAPSSQIVITAAITHVSCNNGNNGKIDISVSGGSAPYTYSWNNSNTWCPGSGNVTTQDRNNVDAGTYSVQVTDANGCTKTATFTVTEPSAISASIAVSPVVTVTNGAQYTIYKGYGAQSVTLSASVSGGTAPYTYIWSGSGVSGSGSSVSVSPTSTKTYTLTITDSKGCTKTVTRTIKVVDAKCGTPGNPNKVLVCHNGNEICVDASAVPAHLAHGCKVGHCDDDDDDNNQCKDGNKNEGSSEATDDNAPGLDNIVVTNINVYPNPSNGTFTIELPANMNNAYIFIMDMAGKIVDRKAAGEEKLIKFDLDNVAKGTYMINVKNGNDTYTSRISIQ